MSEIKMALQEFITLNSVQEEKTEFKWNVNQTKVLIDLYAKYRNKVGTLEMKTSKILWQTIATDLQAEGVRVSANNCLNRWRVIERNYKKFIDNKNATGRGRKYCEYEFELEAILGRKKSISPDMLFSNESIHVPKEVAEEAAVVQATSIEDSQKESPYKLKSRFKKQKTSVLENLRRDRKNYYDEKLKLEKEKLELIRSRNTLIEEQNRILKEKQCNCINLNN